MLKVYVLRFMGKAIALLPTIVLPCPCADPASLNYESLQGVRYLPPSIPIPRLQGGMALIAEINDHKKQALITLWGP